MEQKSEQTKTQIHCEQVPHVCPVCLGRGYVPNGFYTAIGRSEWASPSSEPEICKTCACTGIVWTPVTFNKVNL